MRFFSIALAFLLTFSTQVFAAKKGGTFYYNLQQTPTTLNPLSSTDAYSSAVQGYIIDSLATRNVNTYEWQPALAKSWEVSKDGLTYIFTLRDDAKFHDGKPVTPEDVKFTFDAITDKDNKYKTAHMKPYYENIEKCEVIPGNKVKFTVKKKYFGNFNVAAGISVLPKHVYENPSKKEKKKLNKKIVGSGPYVLGTYKKGKKLILKRNKDWWGYKTDLYKNDHNYDKIHMRFVKDSTIAITRLAKSEIDFQSLTAEEFTKKAVGPRWGKEVLKKKVENSAPQGYGFIGWNQKKGMFQSKKTRLALYHLLNRELMNEKFEYGMSNLATGPIYVKSEYANKTVKPVMYDPKKALALFKEDGWKTDAEDRILYKMIDGKKVRMSFTILEPNKDFMKYLTVYKEDAKKVGVDINLKFVEWTTFIKLLDERKFDAVRLGWSGGSVDMDPKQIWHSTSASAKGSNFISYSNPEVDKLIDQARVTLDKKKRIPMLQKIHKLIADDAPYAFFFNRKFSFYGHTKKMKMEKDTYEYGIGFGKWWIEK